MGWKRTMAAATVVAGLLVPTLPFAAADAPTVRTSCEGGATDFAYVYGVDSDMRVYPDPDGWYYVHVLDQSLWQEDNRVAGLQRTARVCSEYDLVTGEFVRSYTLYPADAALAGDGPSCTVTVVINGDRKTIECPA